jgi:hypothetical protein
MTQPYIYSHLQFSGPANPAAVRTLAEEASVLGIFSGVIGLPVNDLLVLAAPMGLPSFAGLPGLLRHSTRELMATVRPTEPAVLTEDGIYAHRWFRIETAHWDRFLALSEGAWPAFETAFDVRIMGLFKQETSPTLTEVLLLTRYPSLAGWERSRTDFKTDEEKAARSNFVERQGLTQWTTVTATRLHPLAQPLTR